MKKVQYISYLTLLLLYLSSCAAQYHMSKVECDSAFGGTVWIMRKGKTTRGAIFSEDRLTFPAPYNFTARFTPAPIDIEYADKILGDNIKTIKSDAKKFGCNYTLKNKNSLKKYIHQYVGGINEKGERQIYMVLYLKDKSTFVDFTELIVVCGGGDTYITALVNLNTQKLDDYSLGI